MPPLEIGEFTPIPRSLAQEVGLVCAAVYGVIWRYCRKEEGVCRASLVTLGDEINVNKATMMRNIKTLCELGYLIDQTPDRRNAPHTYVLGKTVAERNTSNEVIEDNVEDKSVVMRNSSSQSVADSNKTVAHNNSSIQTVAQSNLKILDSLNPIESIIDNPITSPIGEGGQAATASIKIPEPIPKSEPKIEYTEFEYSFLTYFSAKRFKNPTQHKTIAGLIALHGETEIDNLAQWAAKRGMGLGQAIPAIESALKNPKRKDRQNGATKNGQHSKQPTEKPDLTNPDTWAAQLEAASGKRSPS